MTSILPQFARLVRHTALATLLAGCGVALWARADDESADDKPGDAPAAATRVDDPAGDPPGQADLDAAIDAKLGADDLDDYARVLELCKKAIAKGLDDDSTKFAEELYTGTLVDRASMIVEAIFGAAARDPQRPRLRAFALRDLGEIVERDPTLGQAHLMIARLEAMRGGDHQRAAAAARKALEHLDDDRLKQAQAHVVLADVAEDDESREQQFDEAVVLAPRDAEVRRARGLFRLVKDDFAGAAEDLRAAIAEEPEDAPLHEALGMALAMAGKMDDARAAFDRAIELEPEAAGPLLQRGRLLAVQENFQDALDDIDQALEIEPRDLAARLLRARIRQRSGDAEGAAEDLEEVLAVDDDNAAALELRGLLAAEQEDYAAAIRDFRRLAAQRADDPVVASQLGLLYLAAKQPREAIKRFTRALELDDEHFPSRRGRSDAAITVGDHEAAIADLEKALDLEPDDTGVLNNLAWLLATSPDDDLRDGKRAVELAQKACELSEWEESHIISTLAAAYAETGNFEKAREYSRQAVEKGTVMPEVGDQLEAELASYEKEKPWRERQTLKDKPLEDAARGGDDKGGDDEGGDEADAAEPHADEPEMPAEPAAQPEAPAEEPDPVAPRRPFDDN